MSPDLLTAIKGRRANLRKIWSGKEWKEKKAVFLAAHPYCQMHREVGLNVPATIPHHQYQNSYKGHYTDLELSQCIPYCNRCHFSIHKGRKLCPVCKDAYPRWDVEMCWSCFCKKNPAIVEQMNAAADRKKAIQKAARKAQSVKVKQWKKDHPLPKVPA